MSQKSLLLGCGNNRVKKVHMQGCPNWPGELVTLDMGSGCGADVIWDLDNRPLPFADCEFDELGAYDVLEHIGRQGDWRGWFDEMAEYHRILKPGGLFGIIVPIGQDALADPGHTRFLHRNHFGFLNQAFYESNLAKGKPMTDYRWYWRKDFDVLFMEEQGDHHLAVLLRKLPEVIDDMPVM